MVENKGTSSISGYKRINESKDKYIVTKLGFERLSTDFDKNYIHKSSPSRKIPLERTMED